MYSKIILLLFCVSLIFCGCWFLDDYDDEGEFYAKEPYYVNKSGTPVKIYMRWVYTDGDFGYSYGYIQNGDTLHRTFQIPKFSTDASVFTFPINWNTRSTDGNCGLTYDYDCKNPFFIMLQFLENTTNCLVYSGPVQDNPDDIRSWKAYEKSDTIPESEGFYGISYIYTITPEHRAMAKEEYCK